MQIVSISYYSQPVTPIPSFSFLILFLFFHVVQLLRGTFSIHSSLFLAGSEQVLGVYSKLEGTPWQGLLSF